MALLHIPLDQIDEVRLQALIAAGAPETRTIDYKQATYGNAHADYSEFLADVSSFTNTVGGDLVIGMAAANGIPTAITPLTMPMDPEILRLEQIARGGLQPRITNLAFRAVGIAAGGSVLIVRAPRSFSPPHRVIRQGSNRFWARSAAGKYEPDVNELRNLFNSGPQIAERVRNFRLDRIAKIAARETPVQLMDSGILVIHVVPLSAFDVTPTLPLRDIERDFRAFVPIGSTTATGMRINFEGVLKTSNADPQATQHRAYVQLYRSGIVETVTSTLAAVSSGTPIISNLDDRLIYEIMRTLNDLVSVGIEPPFAVLVSLVEVNGARFNFARGQNSLWFDNLGNPLDRDQYHFDEIIFETVPTTQAECAAVIRPVLDQMANAGGNATSPIFDDQGHYIPLRRG